MIEEEDGFLGGGNDDELIWMDCGVDGGEDFAEPGSAGGFGVAAPVLEEGVVGAGFEGEKFFDGEGFGVGGGEKKFGGKFVFAHVFFDAKGSNLHGESVAARAKCVERQIGWETEGKKARTLASIGDSGKGKSVTANRKSRLKPTTRECMEGIGECQWGRRKPAP